MEGKANILVLGTSGAGKSTLINTIIGEPVAKVGIGKHVTEKMALYENEELNFRLIDSRGFEYSFFNSDKSIRDMRKWLKDGLDGKKERIHMLWFCVDATSKRFTKKMVQMVEQVKKEWKDVPIIIVLTKSFFIAEDDDNIEMVKMNFAKYAKKTGEPIAIIPVLCEPPKGENITSRGIEELVRVTEDNLDDAVRTADEAVEKFDLKMKRMKSQGLTLAATTSASVIGAVPIDFPDAIALTALETTLITSIAKVYKIDKKEENTNKITKRIIEAGTVSIIAKAAIGKLKLIPGIANLAADVLNAIVAGSIVFGIGEASCLIMEKMYLGDFDQEDLKWIDDIVNNSMNGVIKKIMKIVDGSNGKISVKDIIGALFK